MAKLARIFGRNRAIEQQNQVAAIAQQMVGGLPKATYKQSIQAVMKAIEVGANPDIPDVVKNATAQAAVKIVGNSGAMDMADVVDEGLRMRELLQQIENGIQNG